MAVAIVEAAASKKAEDMVVLDVRNMSTLADYFIICTGNSDRQATAIADAIEAVLVPFKDFPHRIEGMKQSNWVLMDYFDVVVHVFTPEAREFYDLEGLWGDAPRVHF